MGDQKNVIAQLTSNASNPDALEQGFTAMRKLLVDQDQLLCLAKQGAIKAVLDGIQAQLGEPMVCEKGCKVLRSLALVADNQLSIRDENGIEILLYVIRGHLDGPNVIQQAFACLRNLALHPGLQTSIVLSGAIPLVLQGMQRHPDKASVQEQGCFVLGNLAASDEARAAVIAAGGVGAVLLALRAHASVDYVQEQGLAALRAMTMDQGALEQIASGEGLELILKAIKSHDNINVQMEGIATLANLATNNEMQTAILHAEGLELVVDTMSKKTTEIDALEQGCKVIRALALQMENKVAVAQAALKTVESVMIIHKTNAHLITRAVAAVRMMATHPDNLDAVEASGVVALAHDYMKEVQGDSGLAQQVCGLLRSVTKYPKFQESIGASGGIEDILRVLSQHPESLPLQKEGWGALKNLAVSQANASRLQSSNISVDLISTMNAKMASEKLQEHLTFALRTLTLHSPIAIKIGKNGGVTTILRATEEHGTNEMILEHVLASLLNLLSNEENHWLVTEQGIYAKIMDLTRTTLTSHRVQVSIQHRACMLLRSLSAFPDQFENLSSGARHSIISAVIRLMFETEANGDLQEECCSIVRILALNKINQRPLGEVGAVTAILKAMRTHMEHLRCLVSAEQALRNLAINEDNKTLIMQNGALPLLIQVLNEYPSSSRVQEQGIAVLWNLASNNLNRDVIVQEGGFEVIASAMTLHQKNAAIQARGCAALRNLSLSAANRLIIGAQSVEHIVQALFDHYNVAEVQVEGCGALWTLSLDETSRQLIGNQEGIEVIVAGMMENQVNAGVQEQACGVLSNLALSPSHHEEILKNISKIVQSMERHQDHKGVQTQGCACLRNMAVAVRNQAEIVRARGIPVVLRAMAQHYKSSGVQEHGSGCIMNLAANQTNQKEIGQQDGCTILLKGLHATCDVPKVLEKGFGAIRNLAMNEDNQGKLGFAAINLIAECLKSQDILAWEGVCLQGISALHSLAVGADAHRVAMLHAGVVDLVLKAMRIHEDNEQLQQSGCLALLTIAWSNKDIQSTAKVAGADSQVQNIMARFAKNEAIQKHGQQILGLLLDPLSGP